jgi:TetR/AcrR family transcriptional repressor of mexJK operon
MSRPDWLAPLDDPRNEAILSAAFDVFVEKGLHGATMLDVARQARVSKETLYARFDSKEGLYYALLAWGCRQSNFQEQGVDIDAYSDPIEALRDYGRAILTTMTRPEALSVYRIAVSEAGRSPEIGRAFNELSCIGDDAFRRALAARLNAAGVAEIADENEFFDCFFGLLRGNYHHNLLMGEAPAPTPELIAERSAHMVARLLAAFAPTHSRGKRAA